MIQIKKINTENQSDLNKANQPFCIIGNMDIRFENGKWIYSEIPAAGITEKQYPDYDGANAADYIFSPDHTAYLAYDNGVCAGQILLHKNWNQYAHIEDISVAKAYRHQGIGTALLSKAYDFAKEKGLRGLSVECQDNNLIASRFLGKNGFEIGGVNTALYTMLEEPYKNETAVFWYKTIK